MPTYINFNMNKRQGTLFDFGVKKSLIESVTQQIMIHPSQSYRTISKTYKRRGKLPAHRRKSLHSVVSTWIPI